MLQFAVRAWKGEWAKGLNAPNLILGSSPDPFVALAAERLASRYRVPFVLEIRDLWPYSIIEVTGRSKFHPFIQAVDWTQRYLYAKAERILVLSKNSTELMEKSGADPDKIVWIPHGVDLSMNPEPRLMPDDGLFTVTYLGAHNEWNSLDSILDAAKLLQESGSINILFRFVGAGESKPALKERARAENIRNVRFEDPIPKKLVSVIQQRECPFFGHDGQP